MRRLSVPALLLALVLATFSQAGAGTFTDRRGGRRAAGPRDAVTGPEVSMAPAYDPAIRRYALRTGPGSTGTVTVTASTSDPAGQVRVNGRPVTGGAITLTGLVPGDEISVIVDDSAGSAVHSLIYLPAAFPDLEGSGPVPGLAPGDLLLTLNDWNAEPGPVPHASSTTTACRSGSAASRSPRTTCGSSRTATSPRPCGPPARAATGVEIVEMNDRFEEIARHRDRRAGQHRLPRLAAPRRREQGPHRLRGQRQRLAIDAVHPGDQPRRQRLHDAGTAATTSTATTRPSSTSTTRGRGSTTPTSTR